MSAFICDPKHFTSIKDATFRKFRKSFNGDWKGLNTHDFKKYLEPAATLPPFKLEDFTKNLIDKYIDVLIVLSVETVCLKYKHHLEEGQTVERDIKDQTRAAKRRTEPAELSDTALFKAIQCMEYQIETEHLNRPETTLEKEAQEFFKTLKIQLALIIAGTSADYEKAKWAID